MARPVGWRKEPARHALAAKGVRTRTQKPRFRTISIQIPADEEDFKMLGYQAAEEEEPINWIRDWYKGLGHEPTREDYLQYAEAQADHILDDPNGSSFEEYLSYLEGSSDYQSSKRAWIEGYASGLAKTLEDDRKTNPNFPKPSDAEVSEMRKSEAAVHGEWTRIIRNAEKQAQLLIREGKPPVVNLTGEPMTYDPKQRAFIGSKYGTVLKVE